MYDISTPPPSISFEALLGALNLSADPIIVYEPIGEVIRSVSDLRIVTMNDASQTVFRIPRKYAVGTAYKALWPPDKERFIWMKLTELLYTDEPQNWEWETSSYGE